MKIKKRSYLLILVLLVLVFSYAFKGANPTVATVFASSFMTSLLLIIYMIVFNKNHSYVLMEVVRFDKLSRYLLWKLKQIIQYIAIDVFILLTAIAGIILLQNGTIRIWDFFYTFLVLFLILTVFVFLISWSKLFFKTALPILGLFLLYDFYTALKFDVNPYLNPFAGFRHTFNFYQPLPESGPAPEIFYYEPKSLVAFLISLGIIVIIFASVNWVKKRKLEF